MKRNETKQHEQAHEQAHELPAMRFALVSRWVACSFQCSKSQTCCWACINSILSRCISSEVDSTNWALFKTKSSYRARSASKATAKDFVKPSSSPKVDGVVGVSPSVIQCVVWTSCDESDREERRVESGEWRGEGDFVHNLSIWSWRVEKERRTRAT